MSRDPETPEQKPPEGGATGNIVDHAEGSRYDALRANESKAPSPPAEHSDKDTPRAGIENDGPHRDAAMDARLMHHIRPDIVPTPGGDQIVTTVYNATPHNDRPPDGNVPHRPTEPGPPPQDQGPDAHPPPPTDRGPGHYAALTSQASNPSEQFRADLAVIQDSRDVRGFAPAERVIVTRQSTPPEGQAPASETAKAATAGERLAATMKELAAEDAPSARDVAAETSRAQINDESAKRQDEERRANAGEVPLDSANASTKPPTARDRLADTMKELAGDTEGHQQSRQQDGGRTGPPSGGRGAF
jgi:hypothetical protein